MLKGIFIASAHEEGELTAVSLEGATEIEPIALRLVIGREARSIRVHDIRMGNLAPVSAGLRVR